MQSYIEVDEEDLYTLKINCKGKRTVGQASKGINVEIYDRLNIKIIKKKENGRRQKKGRCGEENTELQKPNVEAEVHSNNKNCD